MVVKGRGIRSCYQSDAYLPITSGSVYGWRRMTRITDMHGDLKAESSGWLFKLPLAGGGAYCGGRIRPHSNLFQQLEQLACAPVTAGMTTMLALSVYQLIVTEKLPTTSETIPLLGITSRYLLVSIRSSNGNRSTAPFFQIFDFKNARRMAVESYSNCRLVVVNKSSRTLKHHLSITTICIVVKLWKLQLSIKYKYSILSDYVLRLSASLILAVLLTT